MSTETYTLEITETAEGEALAADLYRADRTLEDSLHVIYEEHSLASAQGGEESMRREAEVTTDATRVQLDYQRVGDAFEFRVLGDAGELHAERVTDEDWQLRPSGE